MTDEFHEEVHMMSKNTKRVIYISSAVSLITMFLAFFLTMIGPGFCGVIVNLFGESQGVSGQVLDVGMHWVAPWKRVYKFPTYEQNVSWEGNNAFSFHTSDGMVCTASIGVTYRLGRDRIGEIFQKYRRGLDELTQTFMRNFLRDAINCAASKVTVEQLYGVEKAQFFRDIEHHVSRDLSSMGINLSRVYLIGRFGFPDNVVGALNSKIEAVQRAQQRENELREAEALARKSIAQAEGEAKSRIIQAQAQAQANNLVAGSLSSSLILWHAVQRWDGALPKVTSQAIPMIGGIE